MEDLQLLIDLHKGLRRLGPGGEDMLETALDLAAIDRSAPLRIADIGCGAGASTLALARVLNAHIVAVDAVQEFLDALVVQAAAEGVAASLTPLCCSMDGLPFADAEFDVIWSEGAVYNIGFERGVADWHRYLRPGGLLVVSEITWLTDSRPAQLQAYWQNAYAGIDTAAGKIAVLERSGYSPVGYFVLSGQGWENYYGPLRAGFEDFLARHGDSEEARALVAEQRREIDLYAEFHPWYGYGVYIARKNTAGNT